MENIGPTFKNEWQNNLSTCSRGMMSLIIEEYQKSLKEIDRELDSVYTQLVVFKNHALYAQYDKELNEHIEQFNREMLIKKEKNFHRDKNAFQDQKAYNWKNTQFRTRSNFKQKPNNIDPGLSDASSVSSISSKGSARFKKSRTSKRNSHRSGSRENSKKKTDH